MCLELKMPTVMKLKVSDFTRYPGGRFKRFGPGSGEEFRDDHLLVALKSSDEVLVLLDRVAGYPSSFLEEAFGGLVRAGLDLKTLEARLKLDSDDDMFKPYVDEAWSYVQDAAKASQRT